MRKNLRFTEVFRALSFDQYGQPEEGVVYKDLWAFSTGTKTNIAGQQGDQGEERRSIEVPSPAELLIGDRLVVNRDEEWFVHSTQENVDVLGRVRTRTHEITRSKR